MAGGQDFKIIMKPAAIEFECPHCGDYVRIAWRELDVPDYWGDKWPDVICPDCECEVELEDYEIL